MAGAKAGPGEGGDRQAHALAPFASAVVSYGGPGPAGTPQRGASASTNSE